MVDRTSRTLHPRLRELRLHAAAFCSRLERSAPRASASRSRRGDQRGSGRSAVTRGTGCFAAAAAAPARGVSVCTATIGIRGGTSPRTTSSRARPADAARCARRPRSRALAELQIEHRLEQLDQVGVLAHRRVARSASNCSSTVQSLRLTQPDAGLGCPAAARRGACVGDAAPCAQATADARQDAAAQYGQQTAAACSPPTTATSMLRHLRAPVRAAAVVGASSGQRATGRAVAPTADGPVAGAPVRLAPAGALQRAQRRVARRGRRRGRQRLQHSPPAPHRSSARPPRPAWS